MRSGVVDLVEVIEDGGAGLLGKILRVSKGELPSSAYSGARNTYDSVLQVGLLELVNSLLGVETIVDLLSLLDDIVDLAVELVRDALRRTLNLVKVVSYCLSDIIGLLALVLLGIRENLLLLWTQKRFCEQGRCREVRRRRTLSATLLSRKFRLERLVMMSVKGLRVLSLFKSFLADCMFLSRLQIWWSFNAWLSIAVSTIWSVKESATSEAAVCDRYASLLTASGTGRNAL